MWREEEIFVLSLGATKFLTITAAIKGLLLLAARPGIVFLGRINEGRIRFITNDSAGRAGWIYRAYCRCEVTEKGCITLSVVTGPSLLLWY